MEGHATLDRRSMLRAVATLGLTGLLAGCSGVFGDDAVESGDVDAYLSDTSNFDGIVDETGQSAVRVEVGTSANGGSFGFSPAAIRVDVGATVVWEWVDDESSHDVAAEKGAFESDLVSNAGYEFQHEFGKAGTYLYKCSPHDQFGMNGAVVVDAEGTAEPTAADD